MNTSRTDVTPSSAAAGVEDRLDARYGRTGFGRGPWVAVVAGVVLAVAALVWFFWARPIDTDSALEWSDLAYSVDGDSAATVTWRLVVDPGREVSCALNALNTDYGIVGWQIVEIPGSTDAVRDITESIRTAEHASTAFVYGCWVTADD